VNCIKCENINIKDYPSHAKHGYGRCKKESNAVFYSLTKLHICVKFNEASKEIIEKRIIWNDSKK